MNEIFEKVLKGEIKFYQLDKLVGKKEATELRRKFLEEKLGINLENIGSYKVNPEDAIGKNIENMIGSAQLPLGVAGPLKINGEYAKGEFYIPLATTEGALVASTNRGSSAINLSGGCNVRILKDGMARSPLFRTNSLEESIKFAKWVKENFNKIKEEFEKESVYLNLKEIRPWIMGRNVFLRVVAETGDAMGMNMVTIGCDNIAKWIEKNYDVKCISLSGNLCVDKKPSSMNVIEGRGKSVIAEVILNEKTIKEKLKTKSEDLIEVNYRKNFLGSALAGSLGFNAHYANIIAAMFIACGQDAAQVVESSLGITSVEKHEKGIYVSVFLPSLEVGTVGGGTLRETQKEALQILGCFGGGNPPGTNAKKFAEIIAAAVLAGEISLLSAHVAGHLAEAHARLGR